eukprot:m.144092 g.144092  ORF g.144092 m.144092 type:complete len:159 (-) comp30355_c0_seq1:165-641(-)
MAFTSTVICGCGALLADGHLTTSDRHQAYNRGVANAHRSEQLHVTVTKGPWKELPADLPPSLASTSNVTLHECWCGTKVYAEDAKLSAEVQAHALGDVHIAFSKGLGDGGRQNKVKEYQHAQAWLTNAASATNTPIPKLLTKAMSELEWMEREWMERL